MISKQTAAQTDELTDAVKPATTDLELTASQLTIGYGQPVMLTAKVNVQSPGGGTPSGMVEFKHGGNYIPGCGGLSVDGSTGTATATCTTSTLPLGVQSITASYDGNGNYLASSTASPLTLAVGGALTTITLDASPGTSASGSMVTFTASVGNPASTSNLPSGTVTFSDGATVLGTVQTRGVVNGKTLGQFETNSLAMGRHTITATFDGGAGFARSSAELSHDVTVNLGSLPKLPSGAYGIRDLAGAYFYGLPLAGAEVLGNLADAVFVSADLSGAILGPGGTFTRADFSSANLRNAR